LIVERQIRRRGENGDTIWDALIWLVPIGPAIKTPIGKMQFGLPLGVLPIGIIGARLWFVLNATLGGNRSYIEDPASILRIWEGGLHIFGGFLFGAITLLLFLRSNKLDPWLFLDSAGPAVLIGQGIGRIANFINQELYGPPTALPWGIPIEANHRLPQFQNLSLYPVETTQFHPTFAYEMLWNFAAAGVLLWLSRRYEKELKPGTIFGGWLLAAGVGRVIIEFFRPDQPKIPGLGISYSSIFAAVMAIAGAILLMARYKAINLSFAENWEEDYQVAGQVMPQEEPVKEMMTRPVKRGPTVKTNPALEKKSVTRTTERRTRTTRGATQASVRTPKKKTTTRRTNQK